MENILTTLFGGGILDWQDISKTKYDWEDIFDKLDYNNDTIDINDLYYKIMETAVYELDNIINNDNKILEKYNGVEDFEIYANYCLDSTIKFIGDNEVGEKIQNIFKDEIEEINNKIGFTSIEF